MKSGRAPSAPATILHLCIGLFGVQIVWGLQNANTSGVFQALGADVGQLAILWIAGPTTGALVQPIVGYLSDRTRSRWGRRRPFILAGALAAGTALALFADSPSLAVAAALLWLLGIGANMTMEPLRALTGDLVPEELRTRAFAMQAAFIAAGAVVASTLPWLLDHGLGLASQPPGGAVSEAVRVSYRLGAVALIASIGWVVTTVREHPLVVMPADAIAALPPPSVARLVRRGAFWLVGAGAVALAARRFSLRAELYALAAFAGLYGATQLCIAALARWRHHPAGLLQITEDIVQMPAAMRKLAIVQFFTWLGLFTLWVYTVPAIAQHRFGTSDPASASYHEAANWVGLLFAMYNGFAVLAAPLVSRASARYGRAVAHALSLACGAVGIVSLTIGDSRELPWLPSIGIGIAWASILSLPYAIVATASSASKMGVNMGIHNLFLVVPQLVGAVLLGPIVDGWLGGNASGSLGVAGFMFAAAAFASLISRFGRVTI